MQEGDVWASDAPFCVLCRSALAGYDGVDHVSKNWFLPDPMGRMHLQLCGRGHLLFLLLQLARGTVPSPCPCILRDYCITKSRMSWTVPCTGWSVQAWSHRGGSSCYHWRHCSRYVAAPHPPLIGILKILFCFWLLEIIIYISSKIWRSCGSEY